METSSVPYLNTPIKILIRMYEGLKSNYTKQGAIEFYNYYSKLPLSVILDGCDKIISEPYKGFEFITDLVKDAKYIPMYRMTEVGQKLITKLSTAVADDKISVEQSEEISKVMMSIQANLLGMSGGSVPAIVESILDGGDDIKEYTDWAKDAYDKLYAGTLTTVSIPDGAYATPYFPEMLRLCVRIKNVAPIYKVLFASDLTDMAKPTEREDQIYSKTIFSKLVKTMSMCTMFSHLIERLPDKMRYKLKEVAENDSEVLNDKYLTVHESVSNIVVPSPSDFMESMVINYECEQLVSRESRETQIRNLLFEKTVLEATRDFNAYEYMNNIEDITEDVDDTLTYESVSSKLKFQQINQMTERCDQIDKELLMLEYQTDGDATPVINKSVGAEPPKPDKGSVTRRVQNGALDADIKAKKATAEGKRKFQDVKNAGKAVAKIPENVTDAVNKQIKEWDDMDDERRKEYIIKPGNRKRYWKALKMAIAHGLVFRINPLINIILAGGQWLSSKKNIRIRNELTLELDTELKVLDQKIEDAKSKGDNQASYKLIRMRDKIAQERMRVATNSKIM